MKTKDIMEIVKKTSILYHTTTVYEQQPNSTPKGCFMELYEYRNNDGVESLYGYDTQKEEYREIMMSHIVDVSDSGNKFTPKHSAHTILEYGH